MQPDGLHGPVGNAQHRRRFIVGAPSKKLQLHNRQRARVHFAQRVERAIQTQHLVRRQSRTDVGVKQRNPLKLVSTLSGVVLATVVNHYPAHLFGAVGQQLLRRQLSRRAGAEQPHQTFMDQRCRLESVSRTFGLQQTTRDRPEFRIDATY